MQISLSYNYVVSCRSKYCWYLKKETGLNINGKLNVML